VSPELRQELGDVRRRVEEHVAHLYWDERRRYLADVLRAQRGTPATEAAADWALRMNQLAPVQCGLVNRGMGRGVLDAVEDKLVIPGAVRTLSPGPVHTPVEVRDEAGGLLGDPRMPYRGQCVGTETQRRMAYHNGTAWLWAYPGFVEARVRVCGQAGAAAPHAVAQAVAEGLAWFEALLAELGVGAIGTLSEMKDGDYPHTDRGCVASAAAVAEALRVYVLLRYGERPAD